MMKVILSVLISLLSICDSHDVKLATFKIHVKQQQLFLSINIEKEDLLDELGLLQIPNDSYILENYLNRKTNFTFDSQESCLEVISLEPNENHLILTSRFDNAPINPKMISIVNSCFLSIRGHHNIIKIRTENNERDFLMNADRTSLLIEL